MTKKFVYKPLIPLEGETDPLIEKHNSILSLYCAYKDSGFPAEEIAPEFYRAVGMC
jgi:hypothetical protein